MSRFFLDPLTPLPPLFLVSPLIQSSGYGAGPPPVPLGGRPRRAPPATSRKGTSGAPARHGARLALYPMGGAAPVAPAPGQCLPGDAAVHGGPALRVAYSPDGAPPV